ncbi:nitrous oxide reductase family maturation protein NosD [Brevibacillus sp. SYSU BS000544]|uniref:nitrous oxide reductase family maturation protein NosD n=1 Tax=Brevibacillus sp. SYSU BS000544 TaxID=3416443 RepID=UPI003CE539DE
MKFFCFLLMGFALVTGCPGIVQGEESLQQIIDRSPEKSVIQLEEKTYEGNIVITKPITLQGKTNTVIRGDRTNHVITIRSSGVTIQNVRVEHGSMDRNSMEEYAGIRVIGAANNVIRDVTITDSFHGISLFKANNNQIERIQVVGHGGNEIAGQGNGIHLYYSHGNQIRQNAIRDTRDGMYLYFSDNNTIDQNDVTKTRYGLHFMYSNENRISQNRFHNNSGGAAIMVSKHIQLNQNDFSLHKGSQAFGILMQEGEDIQIRGNRFLHNLRGIYIDNSFNGRVIDNQFMNNHIGIELWASANNQTFVQNRFLNNITPVLTIGGKSKNSWSEDGKGNYWGSSFPLLDVNQDKVGDYAIRYQSSLYHLIKENELTYLFLKSPAIHMYEQMNRWAQKQDVMFQDDYPLIDSRNRF